jgi:hypothetical protein
MSRMADSDRALWGGSPVGRGFAAAVVALVVGVVLSFVFAVWLRASTPDAEFVSRVASTQHVAVWTFTSAHGAAVRVNAGVDVRSERLRDVGDRIGGLLGRERGVLPSAGLRFRLASLTLLLAIACAFALVMRGAGARNVQDALAGAGIAAGVYGLALAALALLSTSQLGFEGRIVSAGVRVSVSPTAAFIFGAGWALFTSFAGAYASSDVQANISTFARAVWRGLGRALTIAAIGSVVLLVAVGGAQAARSGSLDVDPSLAALGVLALGTNAVAAAMVLSHGAPMVLNFDAGPLREWARLGYVPAGAGSLPAVRWLFVLVPIIAGIAAGRRMRSDTSDVVRASAVFGVAWGILLAALAVMLRVEILSTFAITELAPGGFARINPFVALVMGAVVGGTMCAIGMLTPTRDARSVTEIAPEIWAPVQPTEPPAPAPRACASCGAPIPAGDAFCGSCGARI